MSGKKKLVYKQDPDGVFRLKRLNDSDKLSTKSDKRTVDDYLNDLISCAYEVVDPGAKNKEQKEVASPPTKFPDLTVQTDIINEMHESPNISPTDHLNVNTPKFSKGFSPGLNILTPEPESPVATVTTPFTMPLMTQINTNLNMFHIPSFLIGVILALVISRLSPQLLYYGQIFFNYAKIGVIWGIILGTIGWYGGLIKVEKFSFKDIMSRFKAKPLEIPPIPPQEPDIPLMAQAYDEPMERSPSVEYQQRQPLPRRHTDKPRSKSITKPVSPQRNRSTQVLPYKPQPRSQSLGFDDKPKLNKHHTTEPKSNYSKFVERSRKHKPTNSFDSFDSNNLRNPQVPTHQFNHYTHTDGRLTPPLDQPLPEIPNDLPFINEVKLVNGEEDDEFTELPGFGVKRSNTTMSKKSVLGTRANYNRFIDGVQDYE
ncbi:hypothetical protein CLIB1444_02S15852 [[Candida] jaroonii]|uniref:Uncharacterized protein n=1 Tax=[Candida] jaroonii TaxID=467808 RepID=A0ACA9Y4P6_9ASCO|nr:hypothetical protein CLIB1444_02S15852 [[Candida] jaroonii]